MPWWHCLDCEASFKLENETLLNSSLTEHLMVFQYFFLCLMFLFYFFPSQKRDLAVLASDTVSLSFVFASTPSNLLVRTYISFPCISLILCFPTFWYLNSSHIQQLCPFGGQIAHTQLENANLYVSQGFAASTE